MMYIVFVVRNIVTDKITRYVYNEAITKESDVKKIRRRCLTNIAKRIKDSGQTPKGYRYKCGYIQSKDLLKHRDSFTFIEPEYDENVNGVQPEMVGTRKGKVKNSIIEE